MNFDDIPVGGGRASSVPATAVAVSQPKQRLKPIEKKPFLRRGQGVERRVNAYKYRKSSTNGSSVTDVPNDEREVSSAPSKRTLFTSPSKRSSSAYSSPKKATPHKLGPDQRTVRQPPARPSSYNTSYKQRPPRNHDWEPGSHDTDGYDGHIEGFDPSAPEDRWHDRGHNAYADTSPQHDHGATAYDQHWQSQQDELDEFTALEQALEAEHASEIASQQHSNAAYSSHHADPLDADDLDDDADDAPHQQPTQQRGYQPRAAVQVAAPVIHYQSNFKDSSTYWGRLDILPDDSQDDASDEDAPAAQQHQHAARQVADDVSSPGGPQITSAYVRSLFRRSQQQKLASRAAASRQAKAAASAAPAAAPAAAKGKQGTAAAPSKQEAAALAAESQRLQQERTAVAKMRADMEKGLRKLQEERTAWEKQKAAEQASIDALREEEQRKLARERRVLEQQSRAILKLPSKKERSAVQALEAVLAQERQDAAAKDARYKLTVERLRRQVADLQEKNDELQEELRWLQAQSTAAGSYADGSAGRKAAVCHKQVQTDSSVQALIPAAPASRAQQLYHVYPPDDEEEAPIDEDVNTMQQHQQHQQHQQELSSPQQQQQQQQRLHPARGASAWSSLPSAAPANPIAADFSPTTSMVFTQAPAHIASTYMADSSRGLQRPAAAAVSSSSSPIKPAGMAAAHIIRHHQQPAMAVQHAGVNGDAFLAPAQQPVQQLGANSSSSGSNSASSFWPPKFVPPANAGSQGTAFVRLQQQQQQQQQQLEAGLQHSSAWQQPGQEQHIQRPSSSSWQQLGQPHQQRHLQNSTLDHSSSGWQPHQDMPPGQPAAAVAAAPSNSSSREQHMRLIREQMHGISRSITCGSPIKSIQVSSMANAQRSAAAGPQQQHSSSTLGYDAHPRHPAGAQQQSQQLVRPPASDTAPSTTPDAAATPTAASNQQQQVVVQEVRQQDGKVEKHFANGQRLLEFANGTRKLTLPDGRQVIRFSNGDIKQQYPTGKIEYFYQEVGTWHITYHSGLEVFYFPSGQVEGHKPDGSKEIVFADGAVRRVAADGTMQDIDREALSLTMKVPKPLEYVF